MGALVSMRLPVVALRSKRRVVRRRHMLRGPTFSQYTIPFYGPEARVDGGSCPCTQFAAARNRAPSELRRGVCSPGRPALRRFPGAAMPCTGRSGGPSRCRPQGCRREGARDVGSYQSDDSTRPRAVSRDPQSGSASASRRRRRQGHEAFHRGAVRGLDRCNTASGSAHDATCLAKHRRRRTGIGTAAYCQPIRPARGPSRWEAVMAAVAIASQTGGPSHGRLLTLLDVADDVLVRPKWRRLRPTLLRLRSWRALRRFLVRHAPEFPREQV